MQTQQILLLHSLAVGILLLFWMYWLLKKQLFHWNTGGFWAWAAFALYFVANPLSSVISGDYLVYDITLAIAGKEKRAIWIGLVICIGISVFFLVYLRTRAATVRWQLKHPARYSPAVWSFVILCFVIGMPALLTFRIGLFGGVQNVVVEQGRFVGEVSGYEYSAHTFLLVPTVFLILVVPQPGRLVGWVLMAIYVLASLADPWSRFLGVSVLIAISLTDTLRRSKHWPRVTLVVLIVFITTILWIRGHGTFSSRTDLLTTAAQAPTSLLDTLSSGDAAMLATFYLDSYTRDTLAGFDYGIPLLNYSVTGLVPFRLFPQKYFLIDQLRDQQTPRIGLEIQALLYGAKSSLIGSFYTEGGIIAVVLMMALAGWLSRRLDGMLHADAPPLVKATGIIWMSLLWMIWGSADYWALTMLGMVALPAIGIWLLSPKTRSKRSQTSRALAPQPLMSSPISAFNPTHRANKPQDR
ncbi:MAG: hypothetical protein IAE85_10185 [Anaerolinea sp.]|nr:hypothetical protein [Anaerolinea sp.]